MCITTSDFSTPDYEHLGHTPVVKFMVEKFGVETFRVEMSCNHFNTDFFSCLPEFFETLSSSVNFLIFGVFGQKFRKTFAQLFCSWLPFKEAQNYHAVPVRGRKMTLETNC